MAAIVARPAVADQGGRDQKSQRSDMRGEGSRRKKAVPADGKNRVLRAGRTRLCQINAWLFATSIRCEDYGSGTRDLIRSGGGR